MSRAPEPAAKIRTIMDLASPEGADHDVNFMIGAGDGRQAFADDPGRDGG